jgi:crotonobetainyl-CoA:carnitine CoA-transferase CaiB-like acyl-CoA transferase
MMRRPLAGITIAELFDRDAHLALRLAGALAGRIAADLGARVLRLEPAGGDPLRKVPPFIAGTGIGFAFLNAGKETISCAHIAPEDLLAGNHVLADALITDALPQSAEPDRPPITAILSLFKPGAEPGPASEFTLTAMGGLLDMVGDPEREPLKLAGHQAAYAAGLAAFTGIAAALCRAKIDGRFQRETVEVSLLDTIIWLNWKSVPSASASAPPPSRMGAASEWQVLRCADGFAALVYQENDWAQLRALVGDPRLDHASFANRAGRLARGRELAEIIEQRFLCLTRRELHGLALAHRLPIGPVWSPQELQGDEQNLSRDFLKSVEVEGGGSIIMPRLPVIWDGETFAPGRIVKADAEIAPAAAS